MRDGWDKPYPRFVAVMAAAEFTLQALEEHRHLALADAARAALASRKLRMRPAPPPRWTVGVLEQLVAFARYAASVGKPDALFEIQRRLAPDTPEDITAKRPFRRSCEPLEVALRWRALIRQKRPPTSANLRVVMGADVPEEQVAFEIGAAEIQMMEVLSRKRPKRAAGRPAMLDPDLFLAAMQRRYRGRPLRVAQVHRAWCVATGEKPEEKRRLMWKRMLQNHDPERLEREFEAALIEGE